MHVSLLRGQAANMNTSDALNVFDEYFTELFPISWSVTHECQAEGVPRPSRPWSDFGTYGNIFTSRRPPPLPVFLWISWVQVEVPLPQVSVLWTGRSSDPVRMEELPAKRYLRHEHQVGQAPPLLPPFLSSGGRGE